MAAGLQVTNTAGDLVIDSNFTNMQIVTSGTYNFNTSANDAWLPLTRIYLPYAVPNPPLLFLRTYNCSVAQIGCYNNGSGYTEVHVIASGNFSSSHSFDYFIAAAVPTVTTSDRSGLQVWNDTGSLVFDSNNNYLKLVGASTIAIDARNGHDRTHYYDATPGGAYFCTAGANNYLLQDEGPIACFIGGYNSGDNAMVSYIIQTYGWVYGFDASAYLTPANYFSDNWGPRTILFGKMYS